MSVFTIYCHGSGGHRHKVDKEIIAAFGAQAVGEEYRDFLILDGVGGWAKRSVAPNFKMAGSFNWADRNKGSKKNSLIEMGGGHATANSTRGSHLANMHGEGVEDNARHAIVTIANLPQLPDTVNMIGWSRGSVTAMVIANMLYDRATTGLFRQIKVNIFAIDPVAGLNAGIGPGSESRSYIPQSVKNFLGILAKGENRQTFKPQDLSRVRRSLTNFAFLPFPGKHSTVAQDCDLKAKDVSNLVWTMAYRFLHQFGTPLVPSNAKLEPLKSPEGMLDAYSGIVVNKDVLAKIKQKGTKQRAIGKGFGTREFTKHLEEYVKYHKFFVNEHHRKLFKLCCRNLYDWLFTRLYSKPNMMPRTFTGSDPVYLDLQRMRWSKNFVQSLTELEVSVQPNGINVPPAGKFYNAQAGQSLKVDGDLGAMGLL